MLLGGSHNPNREGEGRLAALLEQNASWGLEELVAHANQLLPAYLPEEREDRRVSDAVNARLIRHLTTLGVIDEAGREGREARYTARHLLQLLVARRLLAEGYATTAIKKWTGGASLAALQDLLQRGLNPDTLPTTFGISGAEEASLGEYAEAASNPALDYLRALREGSADSEESSPRNRGRSAPPVRSAPPESRPAQRAPARRQSEPVEEAAGSPQKSTFLTDIAGSPAPATSTPTPSATDEVSQWERVTAEPGLEVHVRSDWRLPPTPHERDALLSRLWEQLKMMAKQRR